MPTKREREYYAMGYEDGMKLAMSQFGKRRGSFYEREPLEREYTGIYETTYRNGPKPKRKLSAWQKFVKANSKKKQFRYRDGKLNLKKMGVAYRRKKRR